MTLHEAMVAVLLDVSHPMRPVEIAEEINKRNSYHRNDGQAIESSQISARANNYPDIFAITDGVIGLTNTQCQ